MGVIDALEFGTELAGFPLYSRVLDLLGSTGTIVPMGDVDREVAARTSGVTLGSQEVTYTWSEAVTSFDTAPAIVGPSRIPSITFNATDEYADIADSAYWSRPGGAFSIGTWVNMTGNAALKLILSKLKLTEREWWFGFDADEKLQMLVVDESLDAQAWALSNAAVSTGVWKFVVMTHDGSSGPNPEAGITLYVDGSAVADTDTPAGDFVDMEPDNSVVRIAGWDGDGSLFAGKMAGGPLGLFFTQSELSAATISILNGVGQSALGL
jgi:hypothetical protein